MTGVDANAPPKALRKDHVAFRPTRSTIGEKSTRLDTGSTLSAPILQETPADVSDPDPLSYAKPQSIPKREIAQSSKGATVTEDPDSEKSTSFTSFTGSPSGEERIKAPFEEFKMCEDDKVEQWCVEMDACLDKLSIYFDEDLYPHMLTAIAGRRWLIGHGLHLAVLKCVESPEIMQAFADVVSSGLAKGMSEVLQYGIEHGKASRDLGDVDAYDPEANDKFIKALQDIKDLKHPIVDQLESRTEKKKKFRVVCHTHGVGSAHHARPDGVALLVPTADPYGLAILLTDTTTQTKGSEGKVSSRLIRSKSLPPMFNSECVLHALWESSLMRLTS
ncbi:hypothetical protein Tco_1394555 [Tanacetum coccineum]